MLKRVAMVVFRLGYVRLLLFIDALILAVAIVDVFRFQSSNLSLLAAISHVEDSAVHHTIIDVVTIGGIIFILVPVLIAVGRTLPIKIRGPGIMFARNTRLIIYHLMFFPVLAIACWLSVNMRLVAGNKWDLSNSYALNSTFVPWFDAITDGFDNFTASVLNELDWIKIIASAIVLGVPVILFREKLPVMVESFLRAADTVDIDPAYAPVERQYTVVFNEPIHAPEVNYVATRTRFICTEYYSRIPGSADANKFLLDLGAQACLLLRNLLIPAQFHGSCRVDLYPNAGRALEAGLAMFSDVDCLVVSPFDQPQVGEVARCYGEGHSVPVHQIALEQSIWGKTWQEQEEEIVKRLGSIMQGDARCAFVMSDVNYWTGMVIPVDRLLRRFRSAGFQKLYMVIEGTRSIGNKGKIRYLNASDMYVFGAHKWLLSPESCGVVVCRTDAISPSGQYYDRWSDSLPSVDPNVKTVASLVAALELLGLRPTDFQFLWERSHNLAEEFRERIGTKFDFVGEVSIDSTGTETLQSTFISVIRPKKEFAWRDDATERFKREGVGLAPPSVGVARGTVTMSFPYFLGFWHLTKVCGVLNASVQNFGGG